MTAPPAANAINWLVWILIIVIIIIVLVWVLHTLLLVLPFGHDIIHQPLGLAVVTSLQTPIQG